MNLLKTGHLSVFPCRSSQNPHNFSSIRYTVNKMKELEGRIHHMSGDFELYPANLLALSNDYTTMTQQMKTMIQRLESVKNNLHSSSYSSVQEVINSMISEITKYSKSITQLKTGLEHSVKAYQKAEAKILEQQSNYTSSKAKNPSKDSEQAKEDAKETLLEMLWTFLDGAGSIPSSAAPYLQMLLSGITGEEIDATFIASILASSVNKYAFFFDVAESGWKEALKNGFGISAYMPEGTVAGKTFAEYFKSALKSEVDSYIDTSSAAKTAGSVAKWGGIALTSIVEGVENYEEYQSGSISGGRAVAETVIETATAIGTTTLATAATGAALASLGIVAAPAIAVAGIATVAVVGVNYLTEHFTGKDIGEWVSDTVCDIGESVGGWFKSLWN